MAIIRWIKNSLSEDVRKALWQYFIDHSKIQRNGYMGILFYIQDEDDFWRRVEYRYTGDFVRYDAAEIEAEAERKSYEIIMFREMARRNSDICKAIDSGENVWKRVILWLYRKSRKYLFGD